MTWPTTALPPVCEDSWRCWTQIKRKRMVITHTEVPEPTAGRGIAGELTSCSFAHRRPTRLLPPRRRRSETPATEAALDLAT